MKKERVIGIVIAAVNAALIIVCATLYLGMDRTAPRFEFQASNMIYREGMDISEFIDGVSAYDDEDGDITDRIVVEKLIKNREENSVIVFYAVSDKAGNVVKSSREFTAIFMEETEKENVQDKMSGQEGEVQEKWLMQTGFWNDLEGNGEETTAEEALDDEALDAEASEDGEKDSESSKDASEKEKEEEEREEENGVEEDGENGRKAAPEGGEALEEGNNRERENAAEGRNAGEASETADGQAGTEEPSDMENLDTEEETAVSESSAPPILTLQVSEVRTQIGAAPAWVEVIGTLSDDKDSYETLFRNLDVSKYDINQAGTYQVTVSTRDSDGNRSQAVPLTIIVK